MKASKKKVFVYYCGGCMSHYDRTKAVQGFLQQVNGVQVSESEASDLALLVCGCPAQCTRLPEIPPPREGRFVLCSPEDFAELARNVMRES